jgi:hypothetical protein
VDVKAMAHAPLESGWRKKAADAVAPRVPVRDDHVRTALGLVFVALAVRTVARALRRGLRG